MAVSSRVQAVFSANSSGLVAGTKRAGTAVEKLSRQVRGMSADLRNVSRIATFNLFSNLTRGAISATASITRLASSGFGQLSKAVSEAVSLGEEMSKSSIVFGESAKAVQAFASTASAIGLSNTAALQSAGSFGTMFRAIGQGQEDAAKMAVTMTKLAADLASFNNASPEEAIVAIGAALRGESEPIRRFGVLLNDATLRQEALAQGLINNLSQALSPAQKAMASYAVVLRQTALAQGDFNRTSDGLANLQRVISAKAVNVISTVGNAFEPLFQGVTSAFSDILDSVGPFIGQVSEGIRQAMSIVGEAIKLLVPQFQAFLDGIDGEGVGARLREAILDGVEFLARGFDYATNLLYTAWEDSSKYIKTFSAAVEVLQAVGVGLSAVFNLGKAAFEGVAALLARAASGWAEILALLPKSVAGDGWKEFAASMAESADDLSRRADESASRALSQGWAVLSGNAGKAMEESMRRPIGAAEAFIKQLRAAGISESDAIVAGNAAAGVVRAAGAEAANQISATKRTVNAVDARSQEGIDRLVRAVSGAQTDREIRIAQQQLEYLRLIAERKEDQVAVASI